MATKYPDNFDAETYPAGLMSDVTVPPPADEYGPALIAEPLGVGRSTDVCVDGDTVFALVDGGLSVWRETASGTPERIGRLDGLHPTRQLAIEGTTAVVTMREGGMAVVDLADPQRPTLAAWYDTIEFATGVALAGGRAYVTNRHYGVEIVDVSDGAHPRPMGWLRSGEAQSVAVAGDIACIGAWRDRQLVIADVSDPYRPAVIATAELDGYADGVTIWGNRCYVATGHHARGIDGFPHEGQSAVSWQMLQQGYGRGHGVEIFDITDPRRPSLISRLKTPPAMSKSPDSWRVTRAGQFLLHADSVNGVFVLDLSRPEPAFVGHARIDRPLRPAPSSGPSLQERGEPIMTAAMGASGTIYASGAETDLYRIQTPWRPAPEPATPVVARQVATPSPAHDARVRLRGEGMVHAVDAAGDVLLAAAGMDGLLGIDRPGSELFRVPFARGARDVVRDGNTVIVAAGHEGLALLGLDHQHCSPIARLAFTEPARFVAMVRPGLVLVVVGRSRVAVVDISTPDSPRVVLEVAMKGNVYGRQIVDGMLAGRYAAAQSQSGGFRWLDLAGDDGAPTARPETGRRSCPITEGAAFTAAQALVVRLGGYYLLAPGEEIDPRDTRSIRLVDGGDIVGVPTIAGNRLIVTNRVSGTVHLIDISEIEAPRSIGRLRLHGQVGRPVLDRTTLYIPAGHAGLMAIDLETVESHGGTTR